MITFKEHESLDSVGLIYGMAICEDGKPIHAVRIETQNYKISDEQRANCKQQLIEWYENVHLRQ